MKILQVDSPLLPPARLNPGIIGYIKPSLTPPSGIITSFNFLLFNFRVLFPKLVAAAAAAAE